MAYLRENAQSGDLVVANHEDLPIKFYCDLRVIGTGTGEDLSDAANADWVVWRQQVSDNEQEATARLTELIRTEEYESVQLDAPDTLFQNREDPAEHLFATAEDEPPVIVLHRVGSL